MKEVEYTFNEDNHTSYELLMDWESGLLDEETGQQITKHLDSCERCSMVYEGLNSIQDASQTRGSDLLNETRKKQQQLLDSYNIDDDKSRTFTPWKIGLSVAASIALLVFLTTLIFPGSNDSDQLAGIYLEEGYRSPVVDRTGNSDSDMERALDFYTAKDYESAIPYFEQIISIEKEDFRALFYAAICYLKLETPDANKAIEYLSLVVNNQSRYKEQAKWFLSLSYYKNGDLKTARELLLEITSKENHFKKNEAMIFLESL